MLTLGVDTGGTFTDFVLLSKEGLQTYKLPSTPDDPCRAILEGIHHFFPKLPDMKVVHGTTVGTNAFLERKGARTLLITTHGFEDVLFIGRQNRQQIYDLAPKRPAAIIQPDQCIGVKERILFDGAIRNPMGKSVAKRLRKLCKDKKIESVAVCFLHAYANPQHEQQIQQGLQSLHLPVTLSSDILPEFREYERLCTTLINAYLAPVISSYIKKLSVKLENNPLYVQQSNGGILPAEGIGRRAIHTILSGPAGGVQGAFLLAQQRQESKIITFDMGGTSTDVSLCDNSLTLTRDYRIDTYPIRNQVIDIHTVGAGGGSIAWIDAGGLLQVGPESAGADPGPACYGKGENITVTDANLFLGRIPQSLLGGTMPLDGSRVNNYLSGLGKKLGMSKKSVALGIIQLVNTNMAKAIRAVSLERGHDPKDFSLYSFGGASGLHCCELAQDLGIKEIVIPARAGILSAQGMIMAQPSISRTQALFLTGKNLSSRTVSQSIKKLENKASQELKQFGLQQRITRKSYLDLRYKGQSYEITVPFSSSFTEHFHGTHQQLFGYCMKDAELELVSIRSTVFCQEEHLSLPSQNSVTSSKSPVDHLSQICFANGKLLQTPAFKRQNLLYGHHGEGPGLIVDDYTTVLIPVGFSWSIDHLINLIIKPM